MGKKSSSTPALPKEYYQALEKQTQLAEQEQDWYQNTMYPWLKETTDKANALAEEELAYNRENSQWWQNYAQENTDKQNAIADYYLDRFKTNYVPVENTLLKEAAKYNGGAEAERQAQLAIGDVASQMATQRKTNQMQMQQYGINPNSGAYQYQQNALALQQAALQATAANQARTAAQELGWNKNMQLAGLGQNYINAAQGMYNTATQTGSSIGATSQNAANTALNASQLGVSNVSNMANIGLNSYNSMANAWGNVGQNYLAGWQAQQAAQQAAQQQKASSRGAILGAVGTIAGTAIGAYTGGLGLAALKGLTAAGGSGSGTG